MERFYAVQALGMDKLLHEVMRDIQRIDPQNVAVKV